MSIESPITSQEVDEDDKSMVKTRQPRGSRPPVVPKWEAKTKERLKNTVRKYRNPLTDLIARDANEGDTRLLVTDFLCEGFGFDKYEDLTTEFQVRGEFADYGVRINRQLVAFVEVKRCSQKLNERHLRQVQMYAVNEGVEWMILTNGQHWEVYHLTGGLPVKTDRVMTIDLLDQVESLNDKVDKLFHLSKEGISHKTLEEFWKSKVAMSSSVIAATLLQEELITCLRKEIKKQTGHYGTLDDIKKVLKEEVLRPELITD